MMIMVNLNKSMNTFKLLVAILIFFCVWVGVGVLLMVFGPISGLISFILGIWLANKFYKSKEIDKELEPEPEKPKVEVDTTKMNYCPECGSKLTPESKFCSNCGYKMK